MSLTEMSYYFRKALPWTIFACIFLMVFYFFIKVFFAYLAASKPTSIVINPIFSQLSPLQVVDPNDSTQKSFSVPTNASFVLDTIEGKPVTATDSAKVFFLPQSPTRLGYVENAYLMAKSFGFSPDVKYQIVGQNLKFADDQRTLMIDVSNFNFQYQYNVQNDSSIFDNTIIPDEDVIKQKASDFIQTTGRFPEELAQGKEEVTLFHYDIATQQFTKVDDVGMANAVEVDFFRPDITGFPIETSKFPYSQNYVVMVFNSDQPTIIKSQIKFFEKEDEKVGIYPIKTGDQAFNDLKNGKAVVVSPGTNNSTITIKTMGMGYYDPDFYQQYLQPVYYFIGEEGFVAYVPAVTDQYVATPSATTNP